MESYYGHGTVTCIGEWLSGQQIKVRTFVHGSDDTSLAARL